MCPSSALSRDLGRVAGIPVHTGASGEQSQAFFPGYLLFSGWFQKVWEMVNEFINGFFLSVCKVTLLS